VQRGSFWEVSNFIDEDIVFEEDDVYAGMTFNFFNCEKCKVTIPGKFKNFMLNKCKRMELNIDSCVSMGEVIKCERIKLYIENTVPQVSIELSNGVQVYGTMESKNKVSLMTTASQSISFTVPKDPGTFDPNNEEHDPNKTEVIPESFCSKFVDGKFTTVAEEGGFD
jgi:adenylyl cyclase-associated protein